MLTTTRLTRTNELWKALFTKSQLAGWLCTRATGASAYTAMQALLASSYPHQLAAFSASQHQNICNVTAPLMHTTSERFRSESRVDLFGTQCAQPSHLRRRAPLGGQQQNGSSLSRKSLGLTASRPKQLHISHATPRQSTKETGHRYALANKLNQSQARVSACTMFPYVSSFHALNSCKH